MKKGKLKKEGNGWKILSNELKSGFMSVQGNFGLTDDLNGKDIEFDNKGALTIKHGEKIFTKKAQQHQNQNMANANNKGPCPARAPYNFVSLNETVVEAQPLPDFDKFYETYDKLQTEGKKRYSGYIDLTIETITPLFIRGEKENFFMVKDENDKPVIPGSSLRGMIRTLVEIVSFGKFDKNRFEDRKLYHRGMADAALKLQNEYKAEITEIEAGYLSYNESKHRYYIKPAIEFDGVNGFISKFKYIESGNNWEIHSGSMNGKHIKWIIKEPSSEKEIPVSPELVKSYQDDISRNINWDILKIARERKIGQGAGQINFKNGVPIFFKRQNNAVTSFGHTRNYRLPYKKNTIHHIVPEELLDSSKADFSDAIFGTTEKAGRIYFEDASLKNNNEEVQLSTEVLKILSEPKPTTFQHYLEQKPLGFKTPAHQLKHWGNADALIRGYKLYWHKPKSDFWKEDIVAFDENKFLEILHGNNLGRDAFDTFIKPRRNNRGKFEIKMMALPPHLKSIILKAISIYENQHTTIKPIENASFSSRIRFENLTKEELGALLFVLDLPQKDSNGNKIECYHKLGMGKPLGLGSVEIIPTLMTMIDRQKRYEKLFEGNSWCTEEKGKTAEIKTHISAFEKYMIANLPDEEKKDINGRATDSLWDVKRLHQLKTMLTFRPPDDIKDDWLERTRYMEIEFKPKEQSPYYKNGDRGDSKNEYKDRPVLPEPDEVIKKETYKNCKNDKIIRQSNSL